MLDDKMASPGFRDYSDFQFYFGDYVAFFIMIFISTAVGIYFGAIRKEVPVDLSVTHLYINDFGSKKMHDYLLGSRQLKIFPVAMSLVASYISGVTMLGTPAEVYNYGIQYWIIVFPVILMGFAVAGLYLPVFSALRVGSSYEYLEMRFGRVLRSMASFMFVMDEVFFLPIIVYVPSIALNQVTGINTYLVGCVLVLICVAYTLVGGIKAVVHTDAWQVSIMFLAMIVVVILSSVYSASPVKVFQDAAEGGRLNFFNLSPSLYERQTFWAVLTGGFFYWTAFNSVNQTMVQRYMSLPSLRKARKAVAIFIVGIIGFITACCYAGLQIYEYYRHCDPLSAGLVTKDDQLLPIFVMQTVGDLHGIPGLFIAGVFGAALSSLSTVLNSTSLVILEDITRGCFKLNPSVRAASILVKTTIVILGLIAVGLIFVLHKLSGILSVATSLTGIASSASFGVFTLGMLIPWSNNKGAIIGALCGGGIAMWISFGSQTAMAMNMVMPHKLPLDISDCPPEMNATLPENIYPDESNVFPLYRLSFHWIAPIGVCTTVIVGTIVSFLTGKTDLKTLNGALITPVLHRFLPEECFQPTEAGPVRLLGDEAKAKN